MRVTKDIYLVGDGRRGLSHDLDCCIYVIDCGSVFTMIDAGVGLDNETIVENIKSDGIELDKVRFLIITHAHSDHAGGAKFFQDSLQTEVLATELEAKLMSGGTDEQLGLDMTRGIIYPEDYRYNHCKPDRVINDFEEIRIGNKTFTFIQVPGHSPGIACVLIRDDKTLFSSDVVFHGGTIGLGNWAGSELSEYRKNIHKLANLGVEKLFPGHFLFTLRNGQKHIDKAIENLRKPWVPPAWQHQHPHY